MLKPAAFLLFMLVFQLKMFSQTAATNLNEDSVRPYTLPDPLHLPGKAGVTSKGAWNKEQRPYIYHLFEENVYGRFPVKELNIRSRLMEEDKHALHGKATRKQVRLFFHPTDSSVYTDLLIYTPNADTKPVAVFVGYNFSGNHTVQSEPEILVTSSWVSPNGKGVTNNHASDQSRGADTASWPS